MLIVPESATPGVPGDLVLERSRSIVYIYVVFEQDQDENLAPFSSGGEK